MSIKIIISEDEIMKNPNDCGLGELIRDRLRDEIEKTKLSFSDSVTENEYDPCVLCGKKSPYLRSTNIYERIGYVEGAGQACFQPYKCGKFF